MNNKLLDNILENLTTKFLENIDLENKEFMKNKFIEYFNKKNKNFDENKLMNEKAKEIFSAMIIKQELSIWENATLDQKKSLIIKDINLDKFYFLSNKIFFIARNRLYSNTLIPENEYNELKEEVNKTFSLIESFNKENAKMDLSESLLDLEYAFGNTTNITSLRLGREIKKNSPKINYNI